MWGFGGRNYWGRRERAREGIVVVFAWMSSEDRHLKNYTDLYSSLGWNSLVCHPQFFNMFFPDKAEAVALDVLNELAEELKTRPCPVVFASFSGGPNACMYKVIQIIEAKCEMQLNLDDCRLVRDCISGFIYDSSPVDFTSDLGRRFVVHPSVLKINHPPRILSWMANTISNGLDNLFLNRFESQRAEYWQTLYSTVSMRAPFLILCSESDDLAPYQVICNFGKKLQELGGDVKIVTMNGSPHVGHYRMYPVDYKAAVNELLGKAAAVYSQRVQQLPAAVYSQRVQQLEGERMGLEGTHERMGLEGTHEEIPGPMSELKKIAVGRNQSYRGYTIAPTDHFLMPSSVEYYEDRDVGSLQNEQKEGVIHLPGRSRINPHGVLGQFLFDVCVPKDVEGWDIKSSASFSGGSYGSTRRHASFNPIKCIRRSRL